MAISSTDIAKAAEAINRHRGLNPSSRRVGLEILNAMNRQTATAWRSVGGLARRLGISERSVSYALRLLRKLDLIVTKPNGGKGLLFRLAWRRIKAVGAAIKRELFRQSGTRTERQVAVPPIKRKDTPQAVADVLPPKNISRSFEKKTGSTQQILTDQQLDGRAQTRIYDALKALGHAAMMQFFNHPDAAQLEADAIKAERFSPDQGRSGLAIIATRINSTVTA